MRAFATRWSNAFSSSSTCHVSGIHKVSGSIAGKVRFASLPAAGFMIPKPMLFGSIAKDVDARLAVDMDSVIAFSSGDVNVVMRGEGVVAHVDESAGTATIVGPEDKVAKLLELLEQGYFATMFEEKKPPTPKEAPFATVAPRALAAYTQLHASCVPSPFLSAYESAFASKSGNLPSSATRPLRALGNVSWATFASGEA